MIRRLPRWTWPVAWLLAFVAGGVNAIGLIGFAAQAITHLTGTTTLAAAAAAGGDMAQALHLAAVAAAFVAGAVAGGLLIPVDPLQLGQRQTAVLALVALLLLASIPGFHRGDEGTLYLAAAACGLQNAMTTSYSGAVVRTSHVTGMFTDLGVAFGHALRGEAVGRRRVLLCLTVISGFFAGGLGTVWMYRQVSYSAIHLLVGILLTLALANARHGVRRRTSG